MKKGCRCTSTALFAFVVHLAEHAIISDRPPMPTVSNRYLRTVSVVCDGRGGLLRLEVAEGLKGDAAGLTRVSIGDAVRGIAERKH